MNTSSLDTSYITEINRVMHEYGPFDGAAIALFLLDEWRKDIMYPNRAILTDITA